MGKTLLQKVWDLHTVRRLPTGQTQLFIGLHLIHEVTTPQAFEALRTRGWKVAASALRGSRRRSTKSAARGSLDVNMTVS